MAHTRLNYTNCEIETYFREYMLSNANKVLEKTVNIQHKIIY